MAMFLGEISFLLALAVFAFGLVLWHRDREATSGPLRVAGAVLTVAAVLAALCTGYWMVRYHVQGDFDRAYGHAHDACAMMEPGGRHGGEGQQMGSGMMGSGMMGREGMGPQTQGSGREVMPMRPGEGGPPEDAPPGHEEHHPEPAPGK